MNGTTEKIQCSVVHTLRFLATSSGGSGCDCISQSRKNEMGSVKQPCENEARDFQRSHNRAPSCHVREQVTTDGFECFYSWSWRRNSDNATSHTGAMYGRGGCLTDVGYCAVSIRQCASSQRPPLACDVPLGCSCASVATTPTPRRRRDGVSGGAARSRPPHPLRRFPSHRIRALQRPSLERRDSAEPPRRVSQQLKSSPLLRVRTD